MTGTSQAPPTVSRRTILVTGVSAALAGCGTSSRQHSTDTGPRRQLPLFEPPSHLVTAVFHLGANPLAESAAALEAAREYATDAEVTAGVQLHLGIGPRVVAAADPALPGAVQLPRFKREDLDSQTTQGDLILLVASEDPVAPAQAVSSFADTVGSAPSWTQRAFHSPRNLLGFLDGTANPTAADELDSEIWIDAPAPVADTTIAVVRRLRINLDQWRSMSVKRQEHIVGRRRNDGLPLSGETVDLAAKRPDGEYQIPAMAHVRRAHPLAAGTGRMLRRGYSYDNGSGDQGLLFIGFQNSLTTFTATQERMDEGDALMAFTTATASGTFLMLPGRSPSFLT